MVSGGLALADGFTDKVKEILNGLDFPMNISDVIRAEDPMRCVAAGALLAAQL